MGGRSRGTWLVMAAVVAAVVGDVTPAPATVGGLNGLIAFVSERDGASADEDIYVIDPDGSGEKRLTGAQGNDTTPAWSPDGGRIAFTSRRDGNSEIYVMNADGSAQTRLTNHPGTDAHPTWSPDGQKVAFTSERAGGDDIWIMNAEDGSGLTRLTTSPEDDYWADWSPAGDRILYTSRRGGREPNSDLYVIAPDGTNEVRLTTHPDIDWLPSWSPDATKIAFIRRAAHDELHVMNVDGTGEVNLSHPTRGELFPSWSPDGTRIGYQSNLTGNGDIYTMAPDGSNPVRVTTTIFSEGGTAWQPMFPLLPCVKQKASGLVSRYLPDLPRQIDQVLREAPQLVDRALTPAGPPSRQVYSAAHPVARAAGPADAIACL